MLLFYNFKILNLLIVDFSDHYEINNIFMNKIKIWSAEFEFPIVYTVSSVFPHPISIFTTI